MTGPGWRSRLTAKACRMAVKRFLRWGDRSELDSALRLFELLPQDHPDRANLSWAILGAMLRSNRFSDPDYVYVAGELAYILDAAPEAQPPDWPRFSAIIQLAALSWAASVPPPSGFSHEQAAFRVRQAAETLAPTDPELSAVAELVHLNLRIQAGSATSTFSGLRLIAAGRDGLELRLRRAFDGLGRPDLGTAITAMVTALAEFANADARGEADAAAAAAARVMEALPALLDALTQVPALSAAAAALPAERVSELEKLAGKASEALHEAHPEDPASIDRAVRAWDRAVRLAEEQGEVDWMLWAEAADAHLARAESGTRHEDDVQRSIELYERAIATAATNPRFTWSRVTWPLSIAYRMADRYEDALRVSRQGVRGTAWNVLLENDLQDAHASIEDAARDAVSMARLQLTFPDIPAAVEALEMGRGLIMSAALATTDMADRLVRAGQSDLAEEWTQAVRLHGAGDVPTELRLRAVAGLAGMELQPDGSTSVPVTEAGAALLKPPSTDEIQAALGRVGADALVYLVGADESGIGCALVVPARGEPSGIFLEKLETRGAKLFEKLVFALSREARDLGPDPGLPQLPASYFAGYCDWLWREAVGQLFGHLASTGLTGTPDRPLRLVLVPMQELALLPWHAASYQADGRKRYAFEQAVFSYAASGRLLCESAQRTRLPLDGSGILIGDPDTRGQAPALPGARLEAAAIHEAFYPAATYLGRGPKGQPARDGTGTAAEVLGWLSETIAADDEDGHKRGGAVMHLACHGAVDVRSGRADSSYLLLDGGNRLSAEEMAGTPTAAWDGISLAVLAACSTAKSGRGYDEAFNLGTVLLARGVRSVVSAQWPLTDAETSVLMFMLHHYLRIENLPPADALRAAQLWMLRDRRPPDSMPAALRVKLDLLRDVRVATWAGLVHSGL